MFGRLSIFRRNTSKVTPALSVSNNTTNVSDERIDSRDSAETNVLARRALDYATSNPGGLITEFEGLLQQELTLIINAPNAYTNITKDQVSRKRVLNLIQNQYSTFREAATGYAQNPSQYPENTIMGIVLRNAQLKALILNRAELFTDVASTAEAEIAATQVDTTQVDTTQVDTTQVDTTQVDTTQVDTTQVDTTASQKQKLEGQTDSGIETVTPSATELSLINTNTLVSSSNTEPLVAEMDPHNATTIENNDPTIAMDARTNAPAGSLNQSGSNTDTSSEEEEEEEEEDSTNDDDKIAKVPSHVYTDTSIDGLTTQRNHERSSNTSSNNDETQPKPAATAVLNWLQKALIEIRASIVTKIEEIGTSTSRSKRKEILENLNTFLQDNSTKELYLKMAEKTRVPSTLIGDWLESSAYPNLGSLNPLAPITNLEVLLENRNRMVKRDIPKTLAFVLSNMTPEMKIFYECKAQMLSKIDEAATKASTASKRETWQGVIHEIRNIQFNDQDGFSVSIEALNTKFATFKSTHANDLATHSRGVHISGTFSTKQINKVEKIVEAAAEKQKANKNGV